MAVIHMAVVNVHQKAISKQQLCCTSRELQCMDAVNLLMQLRLSHNTLCGYPECLHMLSSQTAVHMGTHQPNAMAITDQSSQYYSACAMHDYNTMQQHHEVRDRPGAGAGGCQEASASRKACCSGLRAERTAGVRMPRTASTSCLCSRSSCSAKK